MEINIYFEDLFLVDYCDFEWLNKVKIYSLLDHSRSSVMEAAHCEVMTINPLVFMHLSFLSVCQFCRPQFLS